LANDDEHGYLGLVRDLDVITGSAASGERRASPANVRFRLRIRSNSATADRPFAVSDGPHIASTRNDLPASNSTGLNSTGDLDFSPRGLPGRVEDRRAHRQPSGCVMFPIEWTCDSARK
jgi:hypothetical protein